ncbi:hypothetical protein LOAG_04177 [Loa loa]|uniref:Uncharacterized protein n=1 Tax=Loa loa TaxID=7209 RepID=A0A1S0U2P9_LOALO|nr:hypothetical protein LOAG_04177 [Loa loa]EFO24310.1 hypothetical protein LOAG_04177 [Loa loa]
MDESGLKQLNEEYRWVFDFCLLQDEASHKITLEFFRTLDPDTLSYPEKLIQKRYIRKVVPCSYSEDSSDDPPWRRAFDLSSFTKREGRDGKRVTCSDDRYVTEDDADDDEMRWSSRGVRREMEQPGRS